MEKSFYIPKYKIYCELIPTSSNSKKWNILMIPGWAHSWACYKTTPDGREWWAYLLSKKGYDVYLVDWPWTWRSGYVAPQDLNSQFIIDWFSLLIKEYIKEPVTLFTHSMSGPFGRKLMETCWSLIKKVIGIAPWQMGNIQPEPIITAKTEEYIEAALVETVKYKISIKEDYTCTEEWTLKKLIWDSKHFPMKYFPSYFASLYQIPRFVLKERLNVEWSQLKIVDFKKCKNTEVYVFTWESDTDHQYTLDKTIVDFFNSKQIKAEFIYLPGHWINWNWHMLMLEKNSDEILALINSYL